MKRRVYKAAENIADHRAALNHADFKADEQHRNMDTM